MKRITIYTIFVISLVIFTGCSTQKNLTGDYVEGTYLLTPVYFHFGTHSFKRIEYSDIGPVFKTISKGHYHIAEDTLFLNYYPLKDSTRSYWKYTWKKPCSRSQSDERCGVRFTVVNRKGKFMTGVTLFVLDKDKSNSQSDFAFKSDSLGRYPFISLAGDSIQTFWFIKGGYRSLFLDADSLAGFKSRVRVILSNSHVAYTQRKKKKGYLIKDWDKDKITLRSLENGERLIFWKNGDD